MYIYIDTTLLDSKQKKRSQRLQAISNYWRNICEQEWEHSDAVHEMDSQDSCDHHCWPTAPQVLITSSKEKNVRWGFWWVLYCLSGGQQAVVFPAQWCLLVQQLFLLKLFTFTTTNIAIMTTKFVTTHSKLVPNWQNLNKKKIFIWAMVLNGCSL